jgi:hypothetical protein
MATLTTTTGGTPASLPNDTATIDPDRHAVIGDRFLAWARALDLQVWTATEPHQQHAVSAGYRAAPPAIDAEGSV